MAGNSLPVWRSLLFVPVTQRHFVGGVARRGADAIILDLEDSVAGSEKELARALVPEAAATVSRGGADVVVRINRPLRLAVRDIEAAVGPGVLALALPKVDGPVCATFGRDRRRGRGRARHDALHYPAHRNGRDGDGIISDRRDRPRPRTALQP
jgi:citrate lyase beta subunit